MKTRNAVLALALAGAPAGARAATLVMPSDASFAAERADPLEVVIAGWPARSRALARQMIAKYGRPVRSDEDSLVWFDNGAWRRTVVHRRTASRSFLRRGDDLLEQSVGLQTSAESAADLRRFDRGIAIDAAAGEISSRSSSEALNILALNLAYEVVARRRSPEDARSLQARMRKLADAGKTSRYLDGLLFETARDEDANHWNP